MRTSLPIKHSYLPHKRCRWDTDLAINPYIFIHLTGLAYFFFFFWTAIIFSWEPFTKSYFFPLCSIWVMELSIKRLFSSGKWSSWGYLIGDQIDSQSSKKFYNGCRNKGSLSSLTWPRQKLQRRGGPFLLYSTHPCHMPAICKSKPCLTGPPLQEMPSGLSLPSLSSLIRTWYYPGHLG